MLVIAGMCTSLNAQVSDMDTGKRVIVHFNNGSKISGILTSWEVGKEVTIDADGLEIVIPEERVKKVVEVNAGAKQPVPTEFQGGGLYYKANLQFITGNDGNRAHHRVGYGITASAGYQFSQYIGVGLGAGYREMIWDSGEVMVPVYAELHGYIVNKRIRPYYNVQAGYAFTWTSDNFNIIDAQGGVSLYPSLGLEFGQSDMKYTLDLGYLFQNAEYTYGSPFGDGSTRAQSLRYQRLSVRLGVQF